MWVKCLFMADFFFFLLMVNIRVEIPLCHYEKLLAHSNGDALVNGGDLITTGIPGHDKTSQQFSGN